MSLTAIARLRPLSAASKISVRAVANARAAHWHSTARARPSIVSPLRPWSPPSTLSSSSTTTWVNIAQTRSLSVSAVCAGDPPVTVELVEAQVMLILNLFDKIDNDKLTLDSHFTNDLGLDSLDQVEIILAMEAEFQFTIDDQFGELLWTPRQVIQFICDHLDVYPDQVTGYTEPENKEPHHKPDSKSPDA